MSKTDLTCSVIIPWYNEVDNIANALRRVPELRCRTEVIVVDDGSTDGTAEVVRALMPQSSHLRLIAYAPNRGKGYAVQQGFAAARGDILLILDADMSVPPEDLPKFVAPLMSGRARFVNGTRMVYSMERGAMGWIHRLGNRIFNRLVSWLIGQRITDSLCGTKALFREDWRRIPMQDTSWGDFDLLFGAALLNLPLVEVPIHYRRRVAGKSKMQPFRHGLILLQVCAAWFLRLVFNRAARDRIDD